MFFIIEEAKETVLDFSQETAKEFWFRFLLEYKMIQYNALNVKLSNSELNMLKSAIKNRTYLSSNVIGDSNNENNLPNKLLLTNTQVSKLRILFANNSLANINLSKNQLHKVGQSGGFLVRLL